MTDLVARVIIEGVNKLSSAFSGAAKGIAAQGAAMQAAGRRMQSAGRSMSFAFTAPATAAIYAAANFEEAMLEWTKAADEMDQPGGFEKGRAAISRLAAVLPQSHRELAQLATQASKAGVAFEDVEKFVLLSAKAAAAFDIEAKEAGILIAGIKEGMGLTNDQLQLMLGQMDLLENSYKTTGANLITYMAQEGAVGRAAGMTTEQFMAMGATMEATGISSDKVARSLRRVAMNLGVGSSATKAQVEAFDKLKLNAVTVAKALQEEGGLPKVLAAIKEGLDALPAHERLPTISALVEDMAAAPFTNVLNNLEMFNEELALIGDHTKAMAQLDRSFEIGMRGMWNQLKLLRNAIMDVVFAAVSEWEPVIKSVINSLKGWAAALKEIDPRIITALAMGFGALAVLGPALMVLGFALQGIGASMTFLAAAVASPWLLVLAAGAWAVYSAFKHWDIVGPALKDVSAAWGELAGAVSDTGIIDAISAVAKAFAELAGLEVDNENWSAARATAEAMASALRSLAAAMRTIKDLIENPLDFDKWLNLGEKLKGAANSINPFSWFGDMGREAIVGALAPAAPGAPTAAAPEAAAPWYNPDTARQWQDQWGKFKDMLPDFSNLDLSGLYGGADGAKSPLLQDGPVDVSGSRVSLEDPVPVETTAKLEGKGRVQVDIMVKGPGQVTGLTASDDGRNIGLDTGTSMIDTGAPQ